MLILFTPKTQPFDWENPAFQYLPFKFYLPFLAGDAVRVLDPTSASAKEFLDSVYYLMLTQEDYTKNYKFYNNSRGYIKVLKGTENSTLDAVPGSKDYVNYEKVRYTLTDEEKELGLQFTKKLWRWAIYVRKTERLKNLSGAEATEYSAIIDTVLAEIESATTGVELKKIAHIYLGDEAPDEIVQEYNLSAPTLLI